MSDKFYYHFLGFLMYFMFGFFVACLKATILNCNIFMVMLNLADVYLFAYYIAKDAQRGRRVF